MPTYDSLAQLLALQGTEVVVSDWFTVTQQHIDAFALATGDAQWIHVDPQRAKDGPFGTTIAHGYLTLSLIAGFAQRNLAVRDVHMAVNYGLNRVRFMAPVPVDSRLRARMQLLGATPIDGGSQVEWRVTIERDGADKPVCVAETLARYYTA